MIPRRRFLIDLASGGFGVAAASQLHAAEPASERVSIGVLFFGNSHTYTHQVPMQFDRLCQSTGQFQPAVRSVTAGGVSLARLLDDPRVVDAATEGTRWDVLVLQEQSSLTAAAATFKEPAEAFLDAVRRFTSLFRERNPNLLVVLYQTWPRNFAAWPTDAKSLALFGKSPDEMHQRMRLANTRVALTLADQLKGTDVRVLVSPVGDFWMQVRREHPDIELYGDENHASPAGAWLASYVLLGTIGGRAAIEKASWTGELNKATTAKLREVVLSHPEIFHNAGKVD